MFKTIFTLIIIALVFGIVMKAGPNTTIQEDFSKLGTLIDKATVGK